MSFISFLFPTNRYFHLSGFTKVPLYSLLGISVSFALTFSIIDLLNYVVGFFSVG